MPDQSRAKPDVGAFHDRHVLITGAARGIGKAIAEAFLLGGARVGIADADPEAAAACADALGTGSCGHPYPIHMDVSDPVMVKTRIEQAAAQAAQPFDTLINNAGISPKHAGKAPRIWEIEPAEWQQVMAINLAGSFNAIRYVVPMMRARKCGWIVNMSSIAGKIYSPIVGCHYSASKAGLIGLTRQLAGELGPDGIRVNAISPGRIATSMTSSLDGATYQAQVADTPMGRFGEPGEVAQMALFFSSYQSSFVTGQTVDVAGGWQMT